MATIRERKPGVWEIRVFLGRDSAGRPVQTSKTVRGGKREAQWLDQQLPTWAPSTAANQRSRVGLVHADPIATIPLMRLTAVDVDRRNARLARAGVGEGSIRNQHLVLRAAVTQAVRWGWVTTNVVAIARLGRRKQALRGGLSTGDVQKVLLAVEELVDAGAVEPGAAVALRLAALTGARRSELAALRWDDLADDRLTIDSSLAIIRHGTRKEPATPTLRDDPTKTANRRTVTLDASTVEQLSRLRCTYQEFGPWMLAVGERPVNPERIAAWWRRARDRAGVDLRWRLHDLRHWSATTAIAEGHDIRTVANRLGHAYPAMTLRVYAHAVESADRSVADRLGSVLDGS